MKGRKGHLADIEDLMKQWGVEPPSKALGRLFPKIVGSRKNYTTPTGEQIIEAQLLGPRGETRQHPISGASVRNLAVLAIFNNFAAAKIKKGIKGQVIADAFGILRVGKAYHPLSMEVKRMADNCWSAVVQNLQQVRFFRYAGVDFRRRIAKYGGDFVPKGTEISGVWGMVLAPPKYWHERKLFAQAKTLLEKLKYRKDARVLLASINDNGDIKLVGGHKFPSK